MAVDGLEGFDKATTMPFDVIILDVILPLRNGFDVCRDIRRAGLATPIVLLTARSETIDKVVGLKLGADDYVTKPFQAAELIARIEALLRRVPVPSNHGIYEFGPIRIDVKKKEVTRAGDPVYLTGREFQLLCYLAERAGSTLPRSEILQFVWGYEDGTLTRTVDMHIASLRNKLEDNPKHPELILTATGVGYKFTGSKTV
jgi:DNA-binding response OmpR family regulator